MIMKVKNIMVAVVLAMMSLPASAQKIVVENASINCGQSLFQTPVTATFQLRNKSGRRMTLTEVQPGSGCTIVEQPAGEIGIGDKFFIKVAYDGKLLGHYFRDVTVKSNADSRPVYLRMTGEVRTELKDYGGIFPFQFGDLKTDKNYLEFDDVNKGDNPAQEITVFNAGKKVLQPNLMHLPPYLSAYVMPEKLNPGHRGRISISLASDKLYGYGLTQTTVYLANVLGEKVSNDNAIGVSAVLLPSFEQQTEAQKAFGPCLGMSSEIVELNFNGKKKASAEVTLANTGKAPLNITALQMFTTGLKVTLSKTVIPAGDHAKLKIVGTQSELKKVRTRPRVLMITDDPQHAKVVVELRINN